LRKWLICLVNLSAKWYGFQWRTIDKCKTENRLPKHEFIFLNFYNSFDWVLLLHHIFPRSLDPIWISLTQLLFACIQQHYNLLYFNYSQGLVISKPKEGYFFYYSKIQHFYSIRLMILSVSIYKAFWFSKVKWKALATTFLQSDKLKLKFQPIEFQMSKFRLERELAKWPMCQQDSKC
jgi:hypothetical protein